jgi:hypothetical protein
MKNMIISTVIAGTLLLVIGNPVNQLVTESEAVEVAEVSSVSAAAVAECGRCSEFRKEAIYLREELRKLRWKRIEARRASVPIEDRGDGTGQVPVDEGKFTQPPEEAMHEESTQDEMEQNTRQRRRWFRGGSS